MKQHIFLTFCLLVGCQLRAQEPNLTASKSIDEAVVAYLNKAGNQAAIFTGKEEAKYPTYIINHPYYQTDEYREGTLGFDGIVYPNARLRLNLHTEELILFSPDERFNVIVPTDRVDFATIGSCYIFYNRDGNRAPLPDGYYIRLYDGQHPVFLRETMFMNNTIKDMEVEVSFVNKKWVYVYKDGKYNQVKNKGGVLKLFPAKKKELKKLLKQHRVNFKGHALPDAVVETVRYYEQLP